MSGVVFELPVDEGLVLRLDQPADADEMFALIDRERDDLDRWLPWARKTQEVSDTREVIERSLVEYVAGSGLALTVVNDGHAVGKIGLHGIGEPEGQAELGYWLATNARGRGLITRAACALIGHGFGALGLRRVWLTCDVRNTPSRAVAERLGMRLEGTFKQDRADHRGGFRDSVLYARLASDADVPSGSRPESGFAPRTIGLADGREVTVRAAVPDDAQAIQDYMRETIGEMTRFIMNTPDEQRRMHADVPTWIASVDPAAGELWLMAFDGERVVGSLNCHTLKRKRRAHVGQLGMTLEADYRGQGLGTAILGALVDWAERHPVLELLLLSVFDDNARAHGLYRRCGFVEAGRVPRETKFGPGDYRDEVTMWRDVSGQGDGSAALAAGK